MGIASDFIGERADEPVHRVAGTNLFYYTARLEPDARRCTSGSPPRTPGDDWARPFGEPMRSWPPSFR